MSYFLFWLGQLFGVFALIALFFSFRENKKDKLLFYQIYSNSFCALQYLCLGKSAYTGFLLLFLCLVRNFIYYKYDNKDIPFRWFFLCACLMVFVSFLSFEGYFSFLPMIGIVLNSWGLWQKRMNVSRICEVIAAFLVIIYNIYVLAWSGIFATGFELIMVLIAIYRFDILKDGSLNGKH